MVTLKEEWAWTASATIAVNRCISLTSTHFCVLHEPFMHHSGSLTTSITTFSAPSSALRYGTSALSTYDFDLAASEMRSSWSTALSKSFLHMSNDHRHSSSTRPCFAASDASDWRSSAYDAPPGPETLPSAANDGVARPSACIQKRAEFAPAAAIAPNAPSKKEALYAEPMSYLRWWVGRGGWHTTAPELVPRHICAEPEGVGREAAVEVSGPRKEGADQEDHRHNARLRGLSGERARSGGLRREWSRVKSVKLRLRSSYLCSIDRASSDHSTTHYHAVRRATAASHRPHLL